MPPARRRTLAALSALLLVVAAGCSRIGFGAADHGVVASSDGAVDQGRDLGGRDLGGRDQRPDVDPADHALVPPVDALGADGQRPFTHRLFVAVQGRLGGHLLRLHYDASASTTQAMWRAGDALELPSVGNGLRSMAAASDGRLLVGGGYGKAVQAVSPDGQTLQGMIAFMESDALPLADVPQNCHGICIGAPGQLFVGEYSSSAGNAVAEYALAGETATYQRVVTHTALAAGTLAQCQATGGQLLYSEVDSLTDGDGDLVRVDQQSMLSWQEAARFDSSAFDALQGSSGTVTYGFVQLGADDVYLFPLYRYGGAFTRLIRCPITLDATACSTAGPLPPDSSAAINGADAILAARALPGQSVLLFTSNRAVYRYDLVAGGYQELYDLRAGFSDLRAGAAVDSFVQVRGLVLR